MVAFGRTPIAIGVVFVIVGLVFTLGTRLPGDIVIRGRHSVFYFPLMTCLIVSAVLSLAMWLVNRR
jgi:Protein of unknown function (DUF2905)